MQAPRWPPEITSNWNYNVFLATRLLFYSPFYWILKKKRGRGGRKETENAHDGKRGTWRTGQKKLEMSNFLDSRSQVFVIVHFFWVSHERKGWLFREKLIRQKGTLWTLTSFRLNITYRRLHICKQVSHVKTLLLQVTMQSTLTFNEDITHFLRKVYRWRLPWRGFRV